MAMTLNIADVAFMVPLNQEQVNSGQIANAVMKKRHASAGRNVRGPLIMRPMMTGGVTRYQSPLLNN